MGILVSGFPVKEPFDRRGSLRGARELKPRPERSVGPSGACRHAARRGGGDRFQSDKRDPSVIVCSEIKRCQLPQSTQFFKKAIFVDKKRGEQEGWTDRYRHSRERGKSHGELRTRPTRAALA